jgi:hypothetical protein
MPTPYAAYVGDSNPVDLQIPTLEEYRDAVFLLAGATWDQPWMPSKWTLRQVMVHVAQWEMILGYRVACATSIPGFQIQGADQDALMKHTNGIDGASAFAAFEGARRMNAGLIQALSDAGLDVVVPHPEYGPITVRDIVVQIVGHGMHHLKQIRQALGPAPVVPPLGA